MANRVYQYVATIPAGTPADAPAVVTFELDNFIIEAIDLEVPPGTAGLVGFYLANNGMPAIPRNAGQWIVWDDHAQRYPASDYPTASGWGIVGYNLGEYDHDVIARFHVNPVPSPSVAQAPVVLTFVEHDVKEPPPVVL